MKTSLILVLLVGLGCELKKTPAAYYSQAETSREQGDLEGSIAALQTLVEKYPNHDLGPRSQYLIGEIYYNDLRDYDQAVAAYQRVVAVFPGSPQEARAQFMIGYTYANLLADYQAARQAYQNFLDRFPDHELAPSVQFELEYLGKDINEIPVLKDVTS